MSEYFYIGKQSFQILAPRVTNLLCKKSLLSELSPSKDHYRFIPAAAAKLKIFDYSKQNEHILKTSGPLFTMHTTGQNDQHAFMLENHL